MIFTDHSLSLKIFHIFIIKYLIIVANVIISQFPIENNLKIHIFNRPPVFFEKIAIFIENIKGKKIGKNLVLLDPH